VLLAVLQSTLAAPSDPPVRFTAIVLTPRFSTAPAVAEDNDIVPVDAVPLARAAVPLPRLAPEIITSAAIMENSIRCECTVNLRILLDEQLRSQDKKIAAGSRNTAGRDRLKTSQMHFVAAKRERFHCL
jgi:hypothetical protein